MTGEKTTFQGSKPGARGLHEEMLINEDVGIAPPDFVVQRVSELGSAQTDTDAPTLPSSHTEPEAALC